MRKELEIDEILNLCGPYIHKDYDGDPPIALGSAAGLVEMNISGVANILPFTCMPGTIICAVSNDFKKRSQQYSLAKLCLRWSGRWKY
jgi:predicted nucleotide-binding protein (sugar kinase/HSP70/actin superfamily)